MELAIFKYLVAVCVLIHGLVFVMAEDAKAEEVEQTPLTIIKRTEWLAQPPRKPAGKLQVLPPAYAIISHTGTEPCHNQAQCSRAVRSMQVYHMEANGWDDIGYNFLVGGDGLVYEGRGWDVTGAHTRGYNAKSIGISFIGTFNSAKPTEAQLRAAQALLEYGLTNGKLSDDYKLLGHRQIVQTESPGQVLYDIIKTWSHWSPTP